MGRVEELVEAIDASGAAIASAEEVAAIVSREPLVTHNYERTHVLNLWFVIAGADAKAIAGTIESIRQQTRLAAIDLPMLRAYHLGLGFPLGAVRPARREATGPRGYYRPDPRDRSILAAIEDGLPLVEQPYRAVAEQLRDVVMFVAGNDHPLPLSATPTLQQIGIGEENVGCIRIARSPQHR